MSKQNIKVFIFSQQPLFQHGIEHSLSDIEDIQIMGVSKVTDKVLLTIEVMPPDAVIIDLDAPTDSGLSLAQKLKQMIPNIGIVALTSNPGDDQLLQALESQVAAYLSKETVTSDYLADIIRRIVHGEYPINENLTSRPEVAGKILNQFQELSGKTKDETLISPLTARETEILNYVAQGNSNKQIAAKLDISEQTIKNHVASIMVKLNANARTQAVVIAVQKGLISIS